MARPTKVLIDTHAALDNLEFIKKHNPNKQIIAMVKANAYGHGIQLLYPVLQGCSFGVASTEEALEIKSLNSKANIFCMQGFFDEEDLKVCVENSITLVINNFHQLNALKNTQNKIKFWLKFNTGMNRLGFSCKDINKVEDILINIKYQKCEGVMSHFANSSNPENNLNFSQIENFKEIFLFAKKYNLQTSFSNSGAILNQELNYGDYIRPGIILYGISPYKNNTGIDLGLKKVMNFQAKIISDYIIPKGSSIGYGSKFICKEKTHVGIVSVGYADGYPYHSENLYVKANNKNLPVIGAVSMDMLAVNLSNTSDVKTGDEIELWGNNLHVEEVAHSANTIPWQLITNISRRVPRIINTPQQSL